MLGDFLGVWVDPQDDPVLGNGGPDRVEAVGHAHRTVAERDGPRGHGRRVDSDQLVRDAVLDADRPH